MTNSFYRSSTSRDSQSYNADVNKSKPYTSANEYGFPTINELTIDHKLQLIIYAWLWEMRPQHEEKIFRLYNIKNNHLLRLNASLDELNEVIKKILKCRYISGEAKSDADFVKGCKR